jgi:hypothetical protein
MTSKGLHTLIDITRFYVQKPFLYQRCLSMKDRFESICINNHLRVVGSGHKVFNDERVSPAGWTMFLMLDESHISTHCYTEQGKMALDIFTCCPDPRNHINTVHDITQFIIDDYQAVIKSIQTINRF